MVIIIDWIEIYSDVYFYDYVQTPSEEITYNPEFLKQILFYVVDNFDKLLKILEILPGMVKEDEPLILIIHSHGNKNGLCADGRNILSWDKLFELTAIINTKCAGNLFLILSSCHSAASLNRDFTHPYPFKNLLSVKDTINPICLIRPILEFVENYTTNSWELNKCFENLIHHYKVNNKEIPFILTNLETNY